MSQFDQIKNNGVRLGNEPDAFFIEQLCENPRPPRDPARFAEVLSACIRRELERPRGYGCVTVRNTGSHADMDHNTFLASGEAICRMIADAPWSSITDFQSLRAYGILVEREMFQATRGINTHKGLIFLALFLARAWTAGVPFEELAPVLARYAEPLLDDYRSPDADSSARLRHDGIRDIREVPLTGFREELSIVEALLESDRPDDDLTLLLIARTDDTTTVARSDIRTLREMQRRASALLTDPDPAARDRLDLDYRAGNLSSGGVADLFTTIRLLQTLRKEWL